MKILVTGFEPFGGSKVNPSEQVVKRLETQMQLPGVQLVTRILSVDRDRAPEILVRAIDDEKPEGVICLGEASTRAAISIERVAINLMDYRIADNRGNKVVDEEIIPGGPAAFFATLPVRDIFNAMKAQGVPVELSLSAGAFLCNQVMYRLLYGLRDHLPKVPAGFIHLPKLPEQAAQNPAVSASMAVETSALGINTALQVLAKKNLEKTSY